MCLTIPKKVVEISRSEIMVEDHDGRIESVKSIVDLKIGDYVLLQQNMIIEKINKKEAQDILQLIRRI